ncbi:MAG: histidine phosphatase family protein [Porticoccaceae bacterium]|nr:histidine phosphatase family protein [Porticoccaceae bacterium]
MRIDPLLDIFLARHGETEFNRANRFCGDSDSPLTANGIAEAERNGRVLHDTIGPEDLGIVASPLQRAVHTAEIMRGEIGRPQLSIRTDPRLREISFGVWEGLTLDEIKGSYGDEWARRIADRWHHAPPGGESYAAVAKRAGEWLSEADGRLLVVTHGAVDRILRGLYAGLSPEEICRLSEPQDEVFRLQGGKITTL